MLSVSHLVFCVGVVALGFTCAHGLTDEEKKGIITLVKPFVEDCGKEYGVTEADIKAAKEAGTLQDLDPCLIACVMKKIEIIDDKGMFDEEKATELTNKFVPSEENKVKALEIIKTCKSVNEQAVSDGEKGCERAKLMLDCYLPHMKGLTDEEKKGIITLVKPFVEDCGKEYGVTEADIKAAKEAGTLQDLDPCLIACVMKKIEIIDDKGMFDEGKATELTNKFVPSEENKVKALEIIKTCKSVNEQAVSDGEKGCERAKLMLDCYLPHMKE